MIIYTSTQVFTNQLAVLGHLSKARQLVRLNDNIVLPSIISWTGGRLDNDINDAPLDWLWAN